MTVIAAALVTVAMIAADIASDIAVTDPSARSGWDKWCTAAIIGFAVLVVIQARRDHKKIAR